MSISMRPSDPSLMKHRRKHRHSVLKEHYMSSVKPTSILLFLFLAQICAPFSAAAQAISPNQQQARDIYKELVEINTVTPTGDTAKAAEAMAARLRAAGFAGCDVQVFNPAARQGQLVAPLRATR